MPVGGAETLLVNLLRRLDPSVLQPEVVCLKEPGPLGETISAEFPVHSGLLRRKWDVRVLFKLMRLIRAHRADVVITVGAGDKMFWGRLAAFLAGVPVIASALHSTGWPDGVGRLNRLLTPLTDAFIAVAKSHGEFLQRFEKFPKQTVHVIPNGVDCQRFKPDADARGDVRDELGLPEHAQLVGIVAALRPEKNHRLLLQAAAELRHRTELHWIVVGDGPLRTSLETLATELGIDRQVHFLGTRSDTPRLLAALDVFTLCSLNEASPVSILEALACGIPVVASDVGSVAETVVPGRTGSLFPVNDLNAMTRAIESLLDDLLGDRNVCRRMGEAGRELVLRQGSLESMVRGYQELATTLYDRASRRERFARSTRESKLPA
ncbi:glycosyltransferase [Roseiconus nitratireducens]|nr:glycosyltransferase [Roseiconus nitratireducens]